MIRGCCVILALLSVLRWDLTEDKRYSLNDATIQLVESLDEPVEVVVYLDGDLNSGFKRLRNATNELVEELSSYGDITVRSGSAEEIEGKDLMPTVVHERTKDGKTAQTTIWPYASVSYKHRTAYIPLLHNSRGLSGEENLNQSIENLEYVFAEALHSLKQSEPLRVAFLEGHNELSEREVYDLSRSLARYFEVDRGVLGTDPKALDPYKVVIIADPQQPFSERDKYILDQYLMRGGRILWAVNGVRFSEDALTKGGKTPVIPLELNLSDMLFRYGIRVNPSLLQDVQCVPVPVNVSSDPQQPNYQPVPWYYGPILLTSQLSPITRNVGQVSSSFASHVDAVGGEDGIEKRILLATSTASRMTSTPAEVDLADLNPDLSTFQYSHIPVAVSMEGVFQSIFSHRLPPEGLDSIDTQVTKSVPTKQVVIACGNILRNDWQQGEPLPVGYDRYSGMQFGNRDFLTNAVLFLADDEGLIALREKEIALRLINTERAYANKAWIQTVSIIAPIIILSIIGCVVLLYRRRRYGIEIERV